MITFAPVMKLCFATSNMGKLREAREILPEEYEIVSSADLGITEDIPETGNSFSENSRQKAEYVWNKCRCNCFADDSGLVVDSLGGAPGIYSARYSGPGHDFARNIDKLLHELDGKSDRKARFVCAVTLVIDGKFTSYEGTTEGRIAMERCGDGGFGYDPVFIPDVIPVADPGSEGDLVISPNTEGVTIAELPEDLKNLISHRGEALRKMADDLR